MNHPPPQGLASALWPSPFDRLLEPGFPSLGPPLGPGPLRHPDPLFGDPSRDSAQWPGQQGYADTCTIRCQEFILEQFTGVPFDETALVQEARDAGWYEPGRGTAPQDVGNLLEVHGIPVNRYEAATIFDLAHELAQGHKVIVGVDAGELWQQHAVLESIADQLGISGADHAVVVSGVDTTDPDDVQVIVSDPGTGEAAATYPLAQFVDAWRDSGCFMVATQDPAPPSVPDMVHFDYGLGHLPEVWGLPFDQFFALADQPDRWGSTLDDALGLVSEDPADPFDTHGLDPAPDALAWSDDLSALDPEGTAAG